MHFISQELEKYIENHTSVESELLKDINIFTNENIHSPQMLSGQVQGRFLSMISKIKNPKNILEIGTYTAYSALCLAEGLQSDGKLITLESNTNLKELINNNINMSIWKSNIEVVFGNALESIDKLDMNFDLVFIDADKNNYINYYNAVINKTNKGALIIADNVLWSGKVINDKDMENDKRAKSIDEYNKLIQNDIRVENILLGIRDGLMIARKL